MQSPPEVLLLTFGGDCMKVVAPEEIWGGGLRKEGGG